MRQVQNGTPVVLGGALVISAGLLRKVRGEAPVKNSVDALARQKIERLAMEAVMSAERTKGHCVVDVSAEKCGWDVTSYPPAKDGKQPPSIHIEVKGRVAGAETITVTRNEIVYAVNQAEKFVLAIVFVKPDDSVDGPYYVRNVFTSEPGWGVAAQDMRLRDLPERAERAC